MSYTKKSKNFFLNTNTFFQEVIIDAMLNIKECAAEANFKTGKIDEGVRSAIKSACKELKNKSKKIKIEVFQTGSGTGLNMIMNELIAVKATKIYGIKVHPNDHVNKNQSSNDVVPSAVRISALIELKNKVVPELENFIKHLRKLSLKYSRTIKPGRTHLRDALPVTFGLELLSYYFRFHYDLENLRKTSVYLAHIPLGGSAVGTGSIANDEFSQIVISELNGVHGLKLKPLSDRGTGMKFLTDLFLLSSSLTSISIDLQRLVQDLRLMYSGPFTGINEISIKKMSLEGSSIMPGKTNPVTFEAIMLANVQIMGINHAIEQASLLGEFELSMGIPLIGYDIIYQIDLLYEALRKMNMALDLVSPNEERMLELAIKSPEIFTFLSEEIGYEKASKIIREIARGADPFEILGKHGFDREKMESLIEREFEKLKVKNSAHRS